MKVHPEGVAVLRYFATALLLLLLFVLRFSDLLPRLYAYLVDRGIARYPGAPRNRTRKRYRSSKELARKQTIAFWCFLSLLCFFGILEWFVVPESYAVPKDRIAPLGAAIFSAGVLVIFLGPVRDDHGRNWTRWTYWATVLSTSMVILIIGLVLKPQSPNGILGVLLLGFIPFVWISGFFRQVDRAEAETREFNFTKSYDGSSTTPTEASHPRNR